MEVNPCSDDEARLREIESIILRNTMTEAKRRLSASESGDSSTRVLRHE